MATEQEPGADGENAEGIPVNGEVTLNGADHEGVNGDANANGHEPAQPLGMQGERQPNKVRITTPYLTKYERARVLGTRALQIRCVSPAMFIHSVLLTSLICYVKHERTRPRSPRWRNRCSPNCHKRALAAQNSSRHTTVPTRWQF